MLKLLRQYNEKLCEEKVKNEHNLVLKYVNQNKQVKSIVKIIQYNCDSVAHGYLRATAIAYHHLICLHLKKKTIERKSMFRTTSLVQTCFTLSLKKVFHFATKIYIFMLQPRWR